MKTIMIVFDKGKVIIEGHGFKGVSCEHATAAFEKALGLVKNKAAKAERWQGDVQQCQSH